MAGPRTCTRVSSATAAMFSLRPTFRQQVVGPDAGEGVLFDGHIGIFRDAGSLLGGAFYLSLSSMAAG